MKGRRFCQSRVVPPVSESLNSGDCYILVTPTQIFNWQGKFSNVIERSRSAEIAASILQKKDLGCKGASKVETIEEEKLIEFSRENRRFWSCLTGGEANTKVREAGPAGEDEVSLISQTFLISQSVINHQQDLPYSFSPTSIAAQPIEFINSDLLRLSIHYNQIVFAGSCSLIFRLSDHP